MWEVLHQVRCSALHQQLFCKSILYCAQGNFEQVQCAQGNCVQGNCVQGNHRCCCIPPPPSLLPCCHALYVVQTPPSGETCWTTCASSAVAQVVLLLPRGALAAPSAQTGSLNCCSGWSQSRASGRQERRTAPLPAAAAKRRASPSGSAAALDRDQRRSSWHSCRHFLQVTQLSYAASARVSHTLAVSTVTFQQRGAPARCRTCSR